MDEEVLQCSDELNIENGCPFCQNGHESASGINFIDGFTGYGERIGQYIVSVWFCNRCGAIVGISKRKDVVKPRFNEYEESKFEAH